MKNKIEIHKIELELLNLRLTKAEVERDNIQKELLALKLLQKKPNSAELSTGQWRRATVAAVSVLAFVSLLSASVFHDAQSNVKENNQPEVSAISVLENGQIVRGKYHSASDRKAPPRSGKEKTRLARAIEATQHQWGPLLVLPSPEAKKRYYAFDPLVKEQQENLLTLGFDIGEADGFKGLRSRQAIAEFRALYLPDSAKQLKDAELTVIIATYANLARSDAGRFGIDHGIVAAIRLSSVRTGVNFSYLMKLAAAESNFKPAIEAATSSATGIYQFTHNTWLNTLKTHGAKYGLVGEYAANIEHYVTVYGYQRPKVRNEAMYQHLLELRKNPRVSAIMAAEMIRDSEVLLAHSFDRKPTQTDLYLTHFLGNDAAITFLRSLEQSPDVHAVELFPEAANSNRHIFHPSASAPRTVDEVYALFDAKFSTRRYDDFAAN
jgi:hypothetical protein